MFGPNGTSNSCEGDKLTLCAAPARDSAQAGLTGSTEHLGLYRPARQGRFYATSQRDGYHYGTSGQVDGECTSRGTLSGMSLAYTSPLLVFAPNNTLVLSLSMSNGTY